VSFLGQGGRLNCELVLTMWAMGCERCRTKKLRLRIRSRVWHFGFRVDVGHRKESAAKHGRELAGIDLVAFGFTLMDVFHGQRVAEDEGNFFLLAQVGEPIPGEHAFAPHDNVFAKRLDGVEERVGVGGQVFFENRFSFVVEHMCEHTSGMEIDAAVEFVWLVVVHDSCPPE
jgi:hypothetical protein